MTRRTAVLAVILGCAPAQTTPARADERLPPPQQVRVIAPGGAHVAIADPSPPRIQVFARDSLGAPVWTIDRYSRNPMLSDDGAALLLLPDTGGLVESDDPDQILLTPVRAPGTVVREIALGQVMSTDALQRTESWWLWHQNLDWFGAGWTVLLPSGLTALVDADTGDVSGLP